MYLPAGAPVILFLLFYFNNRLFYNNYQFLLDYLINTLFICILQNKLKY